jgi:hypothetical protein
VHSTAEKINSILSPIQNAVGICKEIALLIYNKQNLKFSSEIDTYYNYGKVSRPITQFTNLILFVKNDLLMININ